MGEAKRRRNAVARGETDPGPSAPTPRRVKHFITLERGEDGKPFRHDYVFSAKEYAAARAKERREHRKAAIESARRSGGRGR